jgi:formate dehydrogenase subunit beta
MKTLIPVEDGEALRAVQGFLQLLLEADVVEALLVPMRTRGGTVTPALVSDAELLGSADPLAPVMPSNAATLAGQLSRREPRGRIGAVLRSCELRALVELVKLQQASLENLMLIAVDCPGTYAVPVYHELRKNGNEPLWKGLYGNAVAKPESPDAELRLACRMCEQPVYDNADIAFNLLDSGMEHGINVSLSGELAERLGLDTVEANTRNDVLDRLVAARTAARDAEFRAIRERLEGPDGIIGVFDACIRCHNCMTVCPICYCKTCVFKSPVFDHEPMRYMSWANQKGAIRLPADSSLFHLTRLNHMGLSCIGCGMCTQSCPADLPVGLVFRAIGQRAQETFDYVPGRSLDETLPLITFKEDEWTEMGED